MKAFLLSVITLLITLQMPAQPLQNTSLGNLKKLKKNADGLSIETTYGQAQVTVYRPGVIRIRVTKGQPAADFSYAVVAKSETVKFRVLETEGMISLLTDSARLNISTNPVRFTLLTLKNEVISQDDAAFGTHWVGDEVTTYKTLQPDEKFIGLGEKTGPLNRRGEGYTNWNSDVPGYIASADPIYATFPFYIGVHHNVQYGVFFDNTFKSYFNFGASNDRFSSFGADAGEMNYYLIYGSTIRQIVEHYTWLTGRMPMPPLWGLGFQQSRWSYFPDKEVLELAGTFRDKKIPLDVVYLDIHYMDAYKVFTWHPERFPKPAEMISTLKEKGIHTALIIDPGIKVEKGYNAYEEGKAADMFLKYADGKPFTAQVWPGWCNFPDFSKPEVRKWWGGNFKSNVEAGVEGFWNDMNEIASWGGGKTPSVVRMYWEGRGADYREGKNAYGLLMSRSTYEGTRALMNRRPLVLTRAAYAGAQRYTAIWTGDNVASDEHMLLGCRLVNSLGITGMAYSGVDVGGFIGNASKELFTRWLTVGTFTPFFRVHKHYDYLSSEPWTYGETTESIARNYISLRYRLLPYLYSAFYDAHTTGFPVSRSLVAEYTRDENCWNPAWQNQYMFGPSLLVAPVESSRESTHVYLPEGEWFDFFTGKQYGGKQEIVADSPLDKLPVFAKGGSFIPMQSVVLSTSEKPSDTLFVHFYNGTKPSSFVYYEDDGVSFDYENGNSVSVRMKFDPAGRQLIMEYLGGTYRSRFSKVKLILHGFEQVNEVKMNGAAVKLTESTTDLLTTLGKNDPGYIGGREYRQPVKTLVIKDLGRELTISW